MKKHQLFIGFFLVAALAVIFSVSLIVRAYETAATTKMINAKQPKIVFIGWDSAAKNYSIVQDFRSTVNYRQADEKTGHVVNLGNGNLTVGRGNETIWQSPADWWVSGYALADANHDGKTELNLNVWKPGDFGPSKPAWVKENDLSVKNHLFVYELGADGVKALWQSSNLDRPTCEFIFADLDGDTKQELGVIEGEYTTERFCRGKFVAVWKWDEWGFYNQWRSPDGHYNDLRVAESGGKKFLQAAMLSQ
jgi:poly-gamma-glutamate synthesis protein (capsule biosynthesis protein)